MAIGQNFWPTAASPIAIATPGYAQNAALPASAVDMPDAQDVAASDIVGTGSRLKASGFSAPSPMTSSIPVTTRQPMPSLGPTDPFAARSPAIHV